MKILGLGVPELVIILVVVLLIFGPKNLPKLGSALGKSVKSLRDGMGAGKDEDAEVVEEVVEDAPVKPTAKIAEGAVEDAPKKKRVVKKVVTVEED